MKILISSDYHIRESDNKECSLVLAELLDIIKTEGISQHWILGDIFDTVHPSPQDLDLFSKFIKDANLPTSIVVARSHESISQDVSVLNHFGLLNERVQLYFERAELAPADYKVLLGHFMVKESLCGFQESISLSDLKGYKKIFLGHQHRYQMIAKDYAYHIGSIRFVNFDEAQDDTKYVGILDLNPVARDLRLKKLTTPIPMQDIHYASPAKKTQPAARSIESEGELVAYLNSVPAATKLRIIIGDFDHFKSFLKISAQFRAKFYQFKEKKDFTLTTDLGAPAKPDFPDFKQAVEAFLSVQTIDPEVKKALLEELK